jgi:hypothetical protein
LAGDFRIIIVLFQAVPSEVAVTDEVWTSP